VQGTRPHRAHASTAECVARDDAAKRCIACAIVRDRPAPDGPSPTYRLGSIGLRVGADEPLFVGGWVPDVEAPGVPPPAPSSAAPIATQPGRHADRPAQPRPMLVDALLDRVPLWLRGAAAPSAAATAWLAVVCIGCVAVTAFTLLHHRAAPASPAATAMTLPAVAVAPVVSPAPDGVVVDVGGRVRRPGLVTLPAGARVADALRAAGGALRQRDLLLLNLAAKVTDGQLLLVGVNGAPAAAAAGGSDAGGSSAPVDLNTATADQLDQLPDVGPVLAQRIIDYRTQHGGFDSVSQLRDVSGIGDATFADLQPLVTV
jgi:competence protein ComEA